MVKLYVQFCKYEVVLGFRGQPKLNTFLGFVVISSHTNIDLESAAL